MKFLRSTANRFVIGVTHVRNDTYTVPANDRRYSRELALVGRVYGVTWNGTCLSLVVVTKVSIGESDEMDLLYSRVLVGGPADGSADISGIISVD
jgi:hypothetical protein